MKKYWINLLALTVLAGCTAEPLATDRTEDGNVMTLIADTEDGETRTVRQDDGAVYWNPGDEIIVFTQPNVPGGRFTNTETKAKQRASFQGKVDDKPTAGYLYAVYPYDPAFTFNGTSITATVPAVQQGVAGSFDPHAFLSAGRTRTQSMTFYHLGGGVKFTLTEEGITSVTLRGGADEALAGKVSFSIDSKGIPEIQSIDGPEVSITLTAPDGGTFEVGKAYHIATLPVDLPNGFTLLFEREDGRVADRRVTKPAAIQRGHFLKLTDVDKDLTFTDIEFELMTSSVNISSKGQDFSIRVRSFEEPHFDIYADWITLVKTVGDRRIGADYVFHAARNKETEERTGYIAVCSDTNCFMVDVNQEAASGDWTEEDFVHHSLGMRFTATWCGWCPYMNTAFYKAKDLLDGRFEIVNLHASSSELAFSGTSALESVYGIGGYPTGIVDGRVDIANYSDTDYTAQNVVNAVKEQEATYPVVTAFEFSSSLSGSTVSVDLTVYAKVADTYKLTALVLENGIIGNQSDNGEGAHSDYHHDRIARLALTSITGDPFTASAGDEKAFTLSGTVPAGCNLDNLEVLVYVQRPFGSQTVISSGNYGGYYVDNSRSAAVGTTAELEFAD
ncbi:MAG: Omp28-related outer membrane protein [Bacteroidales bacterium]|nr:Omp28-related outer membrane protein [Bacteroidales bacterium]